jgi:hypothetical protein
VVIVILLIIIAVVMVAVAAWQERGLNCVASAKRGYREMVAWRDSLREFRVAQCTAELRREAACQRRRLSKELDDLARRERSEP